MTDQLDAAFAALADRTRRDLVARLAVGDATVSELAAPYDMTIQAVSKHLNVLAAAGLVTKRPQAQRRLVHLEADALRTLTTSTTSVLYAAAQQTTDWGAPLSPGQSLAIRIYQLSALIGRGASRSVTLSF